MSGQKTLFESGPETYQADNGTPFRIIKTLGSSSIKVDPRVEKLKQSGSSRGRLLYLAASMSSHPLMKETIEGNADALEDFERGGCTLAFGPSGLEVCMIKLGIHQSEGSAQGVGAANLMGINK